MTPHGAAVAAIVAAAVLWGTTGTASAFVPSVSPLVIGAAAMGFGGLLQAAVNIGAMRRNRGELWSNRAPLVMGALCVAVYPLCFYTSMRLAGVAIGCVVSLASAPLASALLERFLDQARLSRCRDLRRCCQAASRLMGGFPPRAEWPRRVLYRWRNRSRPRVRRLLDVQARA